MKNIIMPFQQHPLSAAFPAMSAEDFNTLVADIKNHGQREPLTLLDGMVLDGWNRYKACTELGIKPTSFNFADDDPVAFVKSQNLHRRHMTASQRAAAVVACSEWHPAGRSNNMEMVSMLPKKNEELAKEAGTTVRTVTDAKAAHKAGLGEVVRDGAMTANEAANVARGNPVKPVKQPPRLGIVTAPIVASEDECTPLDAAHDQIADLQSALVVANMSSTDSDEASQAATLIAELRGQIKTLQATLKAVKISRDGFQNQVAEMQKQINRQRREIDHVTGLKTA